MATVRGREPSDVLLFPVVGDIVRGWDLGKVTKERYEFMQCVVCGNTRWVSHYSNPDKRWPDGRMCKSCANHKRSTDLLLSGYRPSAETRAKIAETRRFKMDDNELLALYLGERLSCLATGKLLGCSGSAATRRLRVLGIPIRVDTAEYSRRALRGRRRSANEVENMRAGWKRLLDSDAGTALCSRVSSRNKAHWDGLPEQEKQDRYNHLRRVFVEWREAGGRVDHRLEKNSNWRGGKSFEPYSPEFNEVLKEQIRDRDGHVCQVCGHPENGRCHDVHHIDFNKKHNCRGNLITLDHVCHAMTFGRASESNINENFRGMLRWILSVRGIYDDCLVGAS